MNSTMSPNYIPKVSVIVPVYNTERYVERAIISLMEQTLDDVQFIIIDDGSKDNSLNIIKQVIARYPARQGQVTLISRENRGVAATRAQGMELATGDYVIHLDSDDWAELNWLEALYTKAIEDNADVVVCNFYSVLKKKQLLFTQTIPEDNLECVRMLLTGNISNMNWDKMVRRGLFEEHKIQFHVGYNMGEDFLITFLVLFNSKIITHVDSGLYFYNKSNDSSLTSYYSEDSFSSLLTITALLEDYLQNTPELHSLRNEINHFKLNTISLRIINSAGHPHDIEMAFSLYPELNKLIYTSEFKMLKVMYFLKKSRLLYLAKYILAARVFKIRVLTYMFK